MTNTLPCEFKGCTCAITLTGAAKPDVNTQRLRKAAQAIGWIVWRSTLNRMKAVCLTHRKAITSLTEASRILPTAEQI